MGRVLCLLRQLELVGGEGPEEAGAGRDRGASWGGQDPAPAQGERHMELEGETEEARRSGGSLVWWSEGEGSLSRRLLLSL